MMSSTVPVPSVTPPTTLPKTSTPVTPSTPAAPTLPTLDMGDLSTVLYGLLVVTSAAVSANHGYHRNGESLGWGLLWGAAGALFPVVAPAAAFIQGYAEPSTDERVKRIEEKLDHTTL